MNLWDEGWPIGGLDDELRRWLRGEDVFSQDERLRQENATERAQEESR